jgi:hypothetical protein
MLEDIHFVQEKVQFPVALQTEVCPVRSLSVGVCNTATALN